MLVERVVVVVRDRHPGAWAAVRVQGTKDHRSVVKEKTINSRVVVTMQREPGAVVNGRRQVSVPVLLVGLLETFALKLEDSRDLPGPCPSANGR